jgi:hypothetical protein
MEAALTKKQVVWLLVRIAGVALLANGIRYFLIVLENIMMGMSVAKGQELLSAGSGLITGWIIEAVLFCAAGFYLLEDGRLLFRWLNRESRDDSQS